MAQQKLTLAAVAGLAACILIIVTISHMQGRGAMRQGRLKPDSELAKSATTLLQGLIQSPDGASGSISQSTSPRDRKEVESAIQLLSKYQTVQVHNAARVDEFLVVEVEGQREGWTNATFTFVLTDVDGKLVLLGLRK